MSIGELLREIDEGMAFTDAQQEVALRWVAELDQGGWLQRFAAIFLDVPQISAQSYQQCMRLARTAAYFGQTDVITAMAGSAVQDVRFSLAASDAETGETPALCAALGDRVNVVNALAGSADEVVRASLGAPNAAGRTPLHVAADYRRVDFFMALLNSGEPSVLAGLTQLDLAGQAPVHIAAEHGLERAVAAVATHPDERVRASLAAADRLGATPAHLAAAGGHEDVIGVLAASPDRVVRGSLQALERDGLTPADVAYSTGHAELADMLQPANLALGWAVADLGTDRSREAGNLKSELQCPVSWMPFTLAGPRRPVQFTTVGGAGAPMEHCLSEVEAQRLVARGNALSPFNSKPVRGHAEAPHRIQLLNQVAQAYQRHPEDLPRARAQALQAYAGHQAALRAPDAAAAAGGTATPQYMDLLARPRAVPGAGAGGPQPG